MTSNIQEKIVAYLKQHDGCASSSGICAALSNEYGEKQNTISQAIKRGLRCKSYNESSIRVKHGSKIIFLPKCAHRSKLVRILLDSGSVCGLTFSGIIAKGGSISVDNFSVLSATTNLVSDKRTLSTDQNLKLLIKENLLLKDGGYYYTETPGLDDASSAQSMSYIHKIVINCVRTYLKETNLIWYKYEKTKEDEANQFKGFYFDIVGWTSTLPCGGKNNFVVADVLLGVEVLTLDHIKYFLRKVDRARNSNRKSPSQFVPIIVGVYFSRESFNKLRNQRILIFTLKKFLGYNALETIEEMKSYAANLSAPSTEIKALEKKLSKIEGDWGNLKADAFELLVGFIVMLKSPGNAIHLKKNIYTFDKNGIKIKTNDGDIDILEVDAQNEALTLHECKCYNSLVNKQEVQDLTSKYNNKINLLVRNDGEFPGYNKAKCKIIIWASSGYHSDVLYRERANVRLLEADPDIISALKNCAGGAIISNFRKQKILPQAGSQEKRRINVDGSATYDRADKKPC